jgi:Carboxypeptidase regulatory-like domain
MQLRLAAIFLICTLAAFAQGDRGTITGTVSDPTGAVVPNANIQVVNSDTAAVYKVSTTSTGNYTLPNLPAGTYLLSVDSAGFKKFDRPGIVVQVAQTLRVDAVLEVGSSTDTVTVNAEAPLLKTESGEISHQVDYTQVTELPLFTTNGAGGAIGNIRDPLSVLNILPGSQQTTDTILRVNGLPSSSQTIMVEGLDATNGMWRQQNQNTQQGVDAIQEVSVQTSNFAAEYGGAGGGYLNFTMKSGTNQYHGSGYEYFVDSAFGAGLPFSANCNQENNCATNPNSGLIKNDVRRNDYGFTFGGPVWIPKVYNGKDKTFFFFNFEQFRQSTVTNNGIATVPTADYQSGNFAAAMGFGPFPIPGLNPISAINQIYDPRTRTTDANGNITESPFPNNTIPVTRMDPVALYLQTFFPKPNISGSGTLNNYAIPSYSNFLHTTIPSIKIDQSLNAKMKLSGYWSLTEQNSPNSNGFSSDLAPVAPNRDRSYTWRVNFDDTIAPTLLFHFGAGLLYYDHPVFTPPSDFSANAVQAAAAGFGGAPGGHTFAEFPANTYMPSFAGLNNAVVGGGLALGTGFFAPSPGPAGFDESELKDIKPTANTSLTWVHGNHTFKAGANMVLEGFPQQSSIRAFGEYTFSGDQTRNPAEYGVSGIVFGSGFPYASFLLGQVSSVQTSAINDSRLGNHTWGVFIQDSWKVSRKLTLELGLRWDYATLLTEQYGRMSSADFIGVNPALASAEYPGGRAGSINYGATNGGQPLSDAYPFALGPHIGVAYQITPKTVFRAGGSIAYSSSPDNAFLSYSVANFYTIASPGQYLPASILANGSPLSGPLTPKFPSYDQYPFPISTTGCGLNGNLPCTPPQEPFITIRKSSGRLPRVFQWSVGFQREIMPNLVVDANYVGNRGAWFTAPLLDTQAFNGLTQNILSNLTTEGPGGGGLYGATSNMAFTNPTDYSLLNSPISSPAVIARFPKLADPSNVYPGFPRTETLAQALRPYPQWFGVPPFLGPPMGRTWYDSLQVKVTKRYSHGLTAQIAYTWSKGLTNGSNSNSTYLTPNAPVLNDPYNVPTIKQLSGFDQPQVLVISFNYQTPKLQGFFGDSVGGKTLSWIARDWNIGGVLKYSSGQLIQSSPANLTLWNTMGIGGTPLNGVSNFGGNSPLANYVPGQSCLAVDPNSHFDPTKVLALNPNRWSQQTTETFGDAAPYYTDCRWQRQPAESLSLGRTFHVTEKVQVLFQAQFFNVFNRVRYPLPAVAGGANVTSATAPTYGNPFPGSNPPGFGQNAALNGGFGFVNTLNGGTSVNGIGPSPRSGQLVLRVTF